MKENVGIRFPPLPDMSSTRDPKLVLEVAVTMWTWTLADISMLSSSSSSASYRSWFCSMKRKWKSTPARLGENRGGMEGVEHDQRRPRLAFDVAARPGEPIGKQETRWRTPIVARDLQGLMPHDRDPLSR